MPRTVKRLTACIAALIVFTVASSAAANSFKPGFHIGGSIATLESGQLRYDNLSALCFGLRANREISRFVDYQFELNFVRKGAETDIYTIVNKTEVASAEGSLKLDYLEIPLMLKAGPNLTSSFNPSVLAGLYLAWNLDKEISYDSDFSDPLEEIDVATSDFGLIVGAALDFTVKGREAGLEIRYSRGIKKPIDRSIGESVLNSVMSFVIYITP
ncbi:MAG: porin family protein [Candidatus Zixiibacteriota bacterium]